MKRYLLLCLMLTALQVQSQTKGEDKLGNWVMLFSNTRLSQQYSLHAEAQLRLYEPAGNFNQLLLRAGLNRHLASGAVVSVGYAYVPTESFAKGDEKVSTTENRLWQQLILNNRLSRVYLEHRYRIEQRWIVAENDDLYLNRLRYRLQANIPLNKAEMVEKTIFLSLYDEVFLNVTDTPFDQNRLYAALGYKVNKSLSLQAGYLRHRAGVLNYNRLQLAISINTDLSTSVAK